jgi:undecaprenyl-diphosphatase
MVAIGLVGFSPVIIWNLQHGAVSLKHVMGQAEMQAGFHLHLSLETFGEFLGSQAVILSPLLFGAMLVAMTLAARQGWRQRDERWLLLFWGWAPTFALILMLSLRQKVQANWAAPAYITAFIGATAALAWYGGTRTKRRLSRGWMAFVSLACVMAFGLTVAFHDPTLFTRLGFPPAADPLARLKGWRTLAAAVDTLAAQMPRPPFFVSDRYQISSELAFYATRQPQTYTVNLGRRFNQYDLWNGLPTLAGHDAIYVQADNATLPQALQAAFQACAEPQPVIIEEMGRELKRFYLFPCLGFSGVLPPPKRARY